MNCVVQLHDYLDLRQGLYWISSEVQAFAIPWIGFQLALDL